jgi:hypothetical protein
LAALNEFRREGINVSSLNDKSRAACEIAFCLGYVKGLIQSQELSRNLERICLEDIKHNIGA